MSSAVYFASDAHFGAGSPRDQADRRQHFLGWLASLEDASHLYLLGDIFDFWLDYPSYMPKEHLEILYGLRQLQERGVELAFVGGNHDVWCGDYLQESLGIQNLPAGTVIEHQGVRLKLHHGDGLLSGDRFYRGFRAIVRNPVAVFLAKSLHPEVLHRIALAISRTSRESHDHDDSKVEDLIHRYGRDHRHDDVDYLVVGHIHLPRVIPFDGWSFACLGDWVQHRTAGRLRDGRFEVIPIPRAETAAPTPA